MLSYASTWYNVFPLQKNGAQPMMMFGGVKISITRFSLLCKVWRIQQDAKQTICRTYPYGELESDGLWRTWVIEQSIPTILADLKKCARLPLTAQVFTFRQKSNHKHTVNKVRKYNNHLYDWFEEWSLFTSRFHISCLDCAQINFTTFPEVVDGKYN